MLRLPGPADKIAEIATALDLSYKTVANTKAQGGREESFRPDPQRD